MVRNRAIVHINIADFAAGVEACLTPSLRESPLIIAPENAPRARVFDMNEAAFREGIRKGMPLARARRLHPRIPVCPPRPRHYRLVMKDLFRQAAAFTPRIESGSTDGHLFLDITGTSRLHGPPPDVAWRLRTAMRRHTGLDPIWTLATSKLVAKAASRVVKPTGEIIVGPGEEAAFLDPLPLDLLPGLTPEECATLARFNIRSVSQARRLSPAQLALPFDLRARAIHDLLTGIDTSPVGSPSPPHTPGDENHPVPAAPGGREIIRAGHDFSDDTNDGPRLKAGLALMTARICRKLRRRQHKASALELCITYSDTLTQRRQKRLDTAQETDQDTELLNQAWDLLLTAWTRRVRIRHLALTCSPRIPVPAQASLFEAPPAPGRGGQLFRAVDRVRSRFGALAVQSGAVLALGSLASRTADSAGT